MDEKIEIGTAKTNIEAAKTDTETTNIDTKMLAETLKISQAELESKIKGMYTEYKEKNKRVRIFDRKRYTTIGLLIMAMAVIGLFWTVWNAVILVNKIIKPDYNEYLNLVEPTVIADTPAFQNTSEISATNLLTFAVWEVILHSKLEDYDKSFDVVFVPQADVEKAAKKLFGECEITHKTIKIGDYTALYNESKRQYVIPMEPKYFSYHAKIKKVIKSNDTIILTVALYQDTPTWQQNVDRIETSALKYMRYTIIKNKITKVENVSGKYGANE
ncbi:hypothetical protein FACS1894132_04980 [Clostridia bacterium]|nr:hypothetical protein FACS1894132_04980 [Clostridia bacterium]